MSRPVVLTIAGYDPSGGAGVTADLRVIESTGCIGISAIAALTVQNTRGVKSVHATDANILKAQLDALFDDIPIAAVKIGMLAGADQVRVVADALKRYRPPYVVIDPVLASTGGVPLLDDDGIALMVSELLPLCSTVTPNLDEAERLTGQRVRNIDEMIAAGRRLQQFGVAEVVVKGGHLEGRPTDIYLSATGEIAVESADRIETPHTHGTGCFLSAGLAGCAANGVTGIAGLREARERLWQGLTSPVVIGNGRGYPDPMPFSQRGGENSSIVHADLISRFRGIYALTDETIRPDRSALEQAAAAIDGGAAIIQIRRKAADIQTIVTEARRIAYICREANVLCIVNDRVDIALASGARGVHLGPDDISPEDARRLLGPDKLVGVSVASVREAVLAAPYASYFGVGAIYGSKTKLDAGAPIGTDRLREIKAAFPHIPIVAIGGINHGNLPAVRDTGVEAAAVVSAVVGADDMAAATRRLVEIWGRGG